MMENGRFIPPSDQRLAAARRGGLFPRSKSLSLGLACLAAAIAGSAYDTEIATAFRSTFTTGIQSAATGRPTLAGALGEAASTMTPVVLALVVAPLFGAAIGAFLPLFAVKRGQGRTAVPFPHIGENRTTLTVFRGVGAALFVAAAVYLVREAQWSTVDAAGVASTVGQLLLRILAALGSILTLIGILEILLMRVAIFEALHLNRGEARREQRAAEGNKEMAAAARRRSRMEGTT